MPETPASSSQRFRGQPDLKRYPASADSQLVYCPLTHDTKIVSNIHMQLALQCKTFATIDEHASRICEQLGYGPLHLSSTRKILHELSESGLLISEQFVLEKLTQRTATAAAAVTAQHPDDVPKISSVGIPTRNRPKELERCIRSFAESGKRYDRKLTFVIADQSEDLHARQINLEMLARVKDDFKFDIHYAGVEEKRNFAARLAEHSGVAPNIVSFALVNDEHCGVDTGINRNALLFSTLGQLTVQVDDDSVCRVMPAPEQKKALSLDSRFSVYEYWFPSEQEILQLSDRCVEQNFFALHEELLGQSLAKCIERFSNVNLNLDSLSMNVDSPSLNTNKLSLNVNGANLDLDNASSIILSTAESSHAHVVATSLGVAGDSGVGSSHYYLNLDGAERSRLLTSEAHYRSSMQDHKVIRSVSRATISDAAFCSGLNLGLDNRRALPPFLPVQRGQDCIFTNLIHACLGSSFTGFLPWAISHRQTAPKKFSAEDLRTRLVYRTSGEIIERLVTGLAPSPDRGTAKSNMVALGNALNEWGTAPLLEFEDLLRKMMWEELSRSISTLQQLLTEFDGKPIFWAKDVHSALTWLTESFTDDRLCVAEDLRQSVGLDEARVMMQRLVRRFGELLTVWVDLRDSAHELHSRGMPLATIVR